jgi:glutathione S-transferase
MTLKIHIHPASTSSRAVMLFAAESGIRYQPELVDLFSGEQRGAAYAARNPNRLVPLLEDGDFRLTESSAILKYLAGLVGSESYPTDLRQRARVNERMDWFNTQLNRDFLYGFVYPQVFPQHRREPALVQQATLDWHRNKAAQWLQVLDRHILGADNPYVCGATMSIADYLGAPMLALGEAAQLDYAAYPRLQQWLARMKNLNSWQGVHAVIQGYAASIATGSFEPLDALVLEEA